MQFAEVVPNTKTDLKTQVFTYNIPPHILSNIKAGSLVSIPFGKRKIEGLVFKIKRAKGKIFKAQLKTILKLESQKPILDETHILLAKWMADYYFAPLSLCIFEMIPLPPRRGRASKQQTVNSGQKVQSPNPYSLSLIIKLCQRVLVKNKQIILLFPEVYTAELFYTSLQKKFKKVVLYHGELKKDERYQTWQRIKNGQFNIIIGSRIALFSPLSKLGLVIINDEEADGYKNERNPRYHLKTVAEKLTEITGAKLVLLGPTPSIGSFYQAKEKKFYLIRPALSSISIRPIVVDMKKEIQKRNYKPFSEILQDLIKKVENQRGQTILFINRKGAASYIFCRDCGYVLRCPNCETPLTYNLQINQLICPHCRYKMEVPTFCPNCRGVQIQFKGVGTQRIETEIKKMFPRPKILRIEEGFSENLNSKPDFIIGTQKILSNWFKPVDLVAVISIDSMLNLPDFRQGEKVFAIISRLKSLAQRLFILQTYHPENFVIQTATKGDYLNFYKTELENRKKFAFSPFSKLIKLVHRSKNEEKTKNEVEFLAKKLKGKIDILGPSPCFYPKIRGKFRWQLILKTPAHRHIPTAVYNLLQTLPSDWIIDVDPISLL